VSQFINGSLIRDFLPLSTEGGNIWAMSGVE